MKKEYKMYLVLGDPSGDGHMQTEKILLESTHPVEDIRKAYRDSCKLTGISFHHAEDDFTGIKRDWREADKYHIATEYEENRVPDTCADILKTFGIIVPKRDEDKEAYKQFYNKNDWFTKLWISFVKLSLPELEMDFYEIPSINTTVEMDVQLGYGLFP